MTAIETKERPILFSAPMVRAILEGRKTQTRRIVKCLGGIRRGDRWAGPANPSSGRLVYRDGGAWDDDQEFPRSKPIAVCPYGRVGDRLWVREAFLPWRNSSGMSHVAAFRADGYQLEPGEKWMPSIHMPRRFSRITLEITEVRVERLQEITEEDAVAESFGAIGDALIKSEEFGRTHPASVHSFAQTWNAINGPDSWKLNPFVWAITFRVLSSKGPA